MIFLRYFFESGPPVARPAGHIVLTFPPSGLAFFVFGARRKRPAGRDRKTQIDLNNINKIRMVTGNYQFKKYHGI